MKYRYQFYVNGVTKIWLNYLRSGEDVSSWNSVKQELKKYNGELNYPERTSLNSDDYYIDFETEEDFIVWKLKFS